MIDQFIGYITSDGDFLSRQSQGRDVMITGADPKMLCYVMTLLLIMNVINVSWIDVLVVVSVATWLTIIIINILFVPQYKTEQKT